MRRFVIVLASLSLAAFAASAKDTEENAREVAGVLSAEYRSCFGQGAPLNAEAYDCLDREYRRLEALLTAEYRAALARQPDESARARLTLDERRWWRSRFRHCEDETGDLQGSTAAVIHQHCEIDALADRIVELRHYSH